jgi:hypothetical protein
MVEALRSSNASCEHTSRARQKRPSKGEEKVNLKLISALAAGMGLMSAAPAFAETVTLDFEGVSSQTWIADYYNGGQDGAGASGPNYGVSFGLDALGLRNDDGLGPYYTKALSADGVMWVPSFEDRPSEAVMNVAAGFVGTASFNYSLSGPATVNIYSGLNGTGDILGTFDLAGNAQQDGCSDTSFCFWSLASADFAGVAHSIQFSSTAGLGGFDDVTVNAVPLPAAAWLLVSALGGMGVFSRRKRAA